MHHSIRLGTVGVGLMAAGAIFVTTYGCSSTPDTTPVDAGTDTSSASADPCSREAVAALSCEVLTEEQIAILISACKTSEAGSCKKEDRAVNDCIRAKKQCAGSDGGKPIDEVCKAELEASSACNAKCEAVGQACNASSKCCPSALCDEGKCCIPPGSACTKDTDCCGFPASSACVSGKCAAKPSSTDAGQPPACYAKNDAEPLAEGVAPSRRPGLCASGEIATLKAACFGAATFGGTACNAAINDNRTCARCMFGSLSGDNAALVPAPAVMVVGPSGAFLPILNTKACAALTINRPDCALNLSQEEFCVQSSCRLCSETDDPACQAASQRDACLTESTVASACRTAVDAAKAQWEATCTEATADAAFDKVVAELCGVP